MITSDQGVVGEVSRVFDSDFTLVNTSGVCRYADYPRTTYPPPSASDTPSVSESNLLWSPVNSKPKLMQLIGGVKQSLVLTTEDSERLRLYLSDSGSRPVAGQAVGSHYPVRRYRKQRVLGKDPAGVSVCRTIDPRHAGAAVAPGLHDSSNAAIHAGR